MSEASDNVRKRKVDPLTIIAHAVTALVVALGTLYVNRPTVVQVPAAVVTPAAPGTAPLAPTVTPAAPTPPPLPTDTVIKCTTVRIEAGTVQLVGNVQVTIPEIKPPSVIIENKLPQAVIDALNKAPVVQVQNYIDPNAIKAPPLPQIKSVQAVPEPTAEGELLPPPKDVKPVRVLPTIADTK